MFQAIQDKLRLWRAPLLDKLIARVASNERSEDYEAAFRALLDFELLFPMSTNRELQPGQTVAADDDTVITIPWVDVQGYRMVLFYTDGKSVAQELEMGGISGREALAMITRMSEKTCDGLVVQNRVGNWLAVPRELALEILRAYPDANAAPEPTPVAKKKTTGKKTKKTAQKTAAKKKKTVKSNTKASKKKAAKKGPRGKVVKKKKR